MGVICFDAETFYDADYSLSKISVEEYIRSPKFELIGGAYSDNGRPPVWYPGEEIIRVLRTLDWRNNSLLAWNTVFDGAILAWRYGIYPALYLDAMGFARGKGVTYMGASLAKVAQTTGVGIKGDEVIAAKGKHLADFKPFELNAYGAYCVNDVNLCMAIYRQVIKGYPVKEIKLQDLTLRMFIEPQLLFHRPTLQAHYDAVVTAKWEALAKAAQAVGLQYNDITVPTDPELFRSYDALTEGGVVEAMRAQLASGRQFAALLESLGIDPPMKLSKTTGLLTHAFAKTDPEFVELLEHPDPQVQAVVAARLGTKSTIEETRAERFLNIQERGAWPVLYVYCGANTTRFTGGDKANPQNLKRGGKLRDAILPPPGHCLVAGDLGQIECRMTNYLAEQDDVVEMFRAYDAGIGPHVYCIFAEKIYRKPVSKADDTEYKVGKIAELQLGYGAADKSYKQMLFAQAGIHVSKNEAVQVVDIYRRSHGKVTALWRQGDRVLDALVRGYTFTLGRHGVLDGTQPIEGIGLPSGMFIRYPKLRHLMNPDGTTEYRYMKGGKEVTIYGAKVIQNCIEGLCRIIMTDAWLRIAQRYRVVLTTHDELVIMAPIAEAKQAEALMREELTRPLPWAPGLPLTCSVGSGMTYGECK